MTTQKMKFSIKDLVIKCDDICGFVRIRTHLLKKSFMENFVFLSSSIEDFSKFAKNTSTLHVWTKAATRSVL